MNISQLKSKHRGKDIYIIASGPSLQFVDKSFFDGKLTIGVNFVVDTIPSVTYHLVKEKYAAELCNCKWHIDVVSEYDCGNLTSLKNPVRHYSFKHKNNEHETFDEELDTDDSLIVSWSTITSAIHFAYFLGAKNIILVGHDCGYIDNKSHISGYIVGSAYSDKFLCKIEPQTLKLKDLLNKKGVNLYSLNPFINFGLEGHAYTR